MPWPQWVTGADPIRPAIRYLLCVTVPWARGRPRWIDMCPGLGANNSERTTAWGRHQPEDGPMALTSRRGGNHDEPWNYHHPGPGERPTAWADIHPRPGARREDSRLGRHHPGPKPRGWRGCPRRVDLPPPALLSQGERPPAWDDINLRTYVSPPQRTRDGHRTTQGPPYTNRAARGRWNDTLSDVASGHPRRDAFTT